MNRMALSLFFYYLRSAASLLSWAEDNYICSKLMSETSLSTFLSFFYSLLHIQKDVKLNINDNKQRPSFGLNIWHIATVHRLVYEMCVRLPDGEERLDGYSAASCGRPPCHHDHWFVSRRSTQGHTAKSHWVEKKKKHTHTPDRRRKGCHCPSLSSGIAISLARHSAWLCNMQKLSPDPCSTAARQMQCFTTNAEESG